MSLTVCFYFCYTLVSVSVFVCSMAGRVVRRGVSDSGQVAIAFAQRASEV